MLEFHAKERIPGSYNGDQNSKFRFPETFFILPNIIQYKDYF